MARVSVRESPATNARDRIGAGPYYNSAGVMLAADKDALHARSGDAALFIDERGSASTASGQDSPAPNQHDILTGCNGMGMLMAGSRAATGRARPECRWSATRTASAPA